MGQEAWLEWSKKAGVIRRRYDKNRILIFNELRKLQHGRFFSRKPYATGEVFVLLYLDALMLPSRRQLYKRLMNGGQIMLAQMGQIKGTTYRHLIPMIQELYRLGAQMKLETEHEESILQPLHGLFEQIKVHPDIQGIEHRRFFVEEIDEGKLRTLSDQLIHVMPLGWEQIVRNAHKSLIHADEKLYKARIKLFDRMKQASHEIGEQFKAIRGVTSETIPVLIASRKIQKLAGATYYVLFLANFYPELNCQEIGEIRALLWQISSS